MDLPIDKTENQYTDKDINKNELMERRDAELRFISCAYKEDEAWYNTIAHDTSTENNEDANNQLIDNNNNGDDTSTDNFSYTTTTVYRRLCLDTTTTNLNNNNRIRDDTTDPIVLNLCIILMLSLPKHYPIIGCISVSGKIEEYKNNMKNKKNINDAIDTVQVRPQQQYTNSSIWNTASKSLNNLIQICQETSNTFEGSESIFSIFSIADEWINETWNNIILQEEKLKHQLFESQQINSIVQSSKVVTQQQQDDDELEKKEDTITIIDIILCRMVLYSHHIISKVKRYDILSLTNECQLSGYCKIGWPGIIIIEGQQDDCITFYNIIRRWTWQYLVRRGEEIEHYTISTIPSNTVTATKQSMIQNFINTKRLLPTFSEVDTISIVASHCRSVGLESLFLTSMKVYNNNKDTDSSSTNNNQSNNNNNKFVNTNTNDNVLKSAIATATTNNDNTRKKVKTKKKNNIDKQVLPVSNSNNNSDNDNNKLENDATSTSSSNTCYYGCLVHVDHMNDVKNYFKWLQSTCVEYNVQILMKHCYPIVNDNSDSSTSINNNCYKKRPKIFVLLLGIRIDDIRLVLKSWRSNKVDIDSKGKACYERMMSVLIEGNVLIPLGDTTKRILSFDNDDDKVNGGQQVVTATKATETKSTTTRIMRNDDTIQDESNIIFLKTTMIDTAASTTNRNSNIYSTYNNIIDLVYMIGGQSWKDCIIPILYPSS